MGNLYTYLLDNGLNSNMLAPFIYSKNDIGLKKALLNKLDRVDLNSKKRYWKESVEFKIFDMLRAVCDEDEKVYDLLNDRIYIDSVPLGKKNVSDNVLFEFDGEDDQTVKKKYELKLSEILPNYKDQTEALTKVIENFDPSIKPFLRLKVFKARLKHQNEIFKEIHEIEEKVLTPYQILFLLLHKKRILK